MTATPDPRQSDNGEDAVEVAELLEVRQFLQPEFLVRGGGLSAVIQPDRAEIADDSPRAVGPSVEVIPALFDRGSTIGFVPIQVS